MKVLCVIDMQKDFIDGALGTKEAVAIVDSVREKINLYRSKGDTVIFTRDTHYDNYAETQEGRKLPVVHCVKDTEGWQIDSSLQVKDSLVIDKPSFGSLELAESIYNMDNVEGIELVGLCTDICVISNAMIIKAKMPEIPVGVDSSCCAGVTPESHRNALESMKMCQIEVL